MNTTRKAFKYRLYPTKAQVEALSEMLETHRRLYNRALAERKEAYETEKRSVTYYDQAKALTPERKGHPYLEKCSAQSCQATLKRLDKAFQNFFRRVKQGGEPGYPRFKGYGRFDSVEFPQYGTGCKLDGAKHLRVQNIGQVKIKLHRATEGKIKTATIKREADHWYAVFSCELEVAPVTPSNLPPVGIDLGLKSFLVTSNGEAIEPPRHYRKAEQKLKKLQRRLSRKKKGSVNRGKARLKVARLHCKIANQRRDFHHKTALNLVRTYGTIAREDLNVKGIARTRLAKSTHDAGWAQFVGILEHKAAEANVLMIAVNPRNTSQWCSACGALPEIKLVLGDDTHHCVSCGQVLDRDLNAARNILMLATT